MTGNEGPAPGVVPGRLGAGRRPEDQEPGRAPPGTRVGGGGGRLLPYSSSSSEKERSDPREPTRGGVRGVLPPGSTARAPRRRRRRVAGREVEVAERSLQSGVQPGEADLPLHGRRPRRLCSGAVRAPPLPLLVTEELRVVPSGPSSEVPESLQDLEGVGTGHVLRGRGRRVRRTFGGLAALLPSRGPSSPEPSRSRGDERDDADLEGRSVLLLLLLLLGPSLAAIIDPAAA